MEPSTTKAPQESFSQSQIEELLARIGDVQSPAIEADDRGGNTTQLLLRHEFPSLYSFSPQQLRGLRVRHEDYIRSLACRLSARLRLECGLQMSKLESGTLQQFADSISSPTHLSVLKLEPLHGVCFLDIPLRLGLCIVDRELGGSGKSIDEARELTKIEGKLLSRVVEIIAGEWCGTWKDLLDLRPILVGYQGNASGLSLEKDAGLMLVVGIEVRMGGVVEQMSLGIPYRTLGPLIDKLLLETDGQTEPQKKAQLRLPQWNVIFDDVQVEVTAQLPRVQVTARQLSQLRVGDILPLPEAFTRQVQINLASVPKFIGTAGRSDQKWAVKIEGVAASDSHTEALVLSIER